MKKIFTLFLILGSTMQAFAQSGTDDIIEPKHVVIRKTGALVTDSIAHWSTVKEMIAAFGQPTSTEAMYWEMEDITVNEYHYGSDATFTFEDRGLRLIEIYSSLFYIGKPGGLVYIKPGEKISTLQSTFPNSYANRINHDNAIVLRFGLSESVIVVYYNPDSNTITKMEQSTGS